MPGHIKLKKGAVDPDPSEFLIPSLEVKRADQQKVYDTKKSVWISDPKTGGYREGLLEEGDVEDPGSKCVVSVAHEKFTLKGAEVGKVNPPKFEKCEDMVNLTFLNDASVFWNLKTRYQCKLIHTYSGLFVVVVNPYKRYPLYTLRVSKIYLGKRRNEVPPHLWAIAEGAYRGMLQNIKDQAMLITGESGAGKTENTKKVITYLAIVAASSKKVEKKVSLEDQIVATNPILESYGNAKTARNDNSSRFGKFIRIHFNSAGKLAGCDIVSYLLEKSRITEQQEVERSYHIFYQLQQTFCPVMQEKCICTTDPYDYSFISMGKVKVESIDDNEEQEYTLDAFNVLGFTELETWSCLRLTSGVMTCGEVVYKTKGRDDQAENEETQEGTVPWKVAELWGVNVHVMIKAFCKPRIKVGTEWVTKGQTCEQAGMATAGIARAVYDRLFKWLIEKCNDTLIDPTMKKANFCAVLDIAGFEIFEYNGFEQISINFVNEKLQQFFNHHMFVVEQEEYVKEGIDWAMVDFGMDLAACIIMFEKPMGIWAILEEESLFPKATDKSFEEKLKASLGKIPCFQKAKSATDKNAHFACVHYAGTVSYNVTGWLEKNKDPVNETVVEVLKQGSCELMVHLWREHPGQPAVAPKEEGKKKKKGGGGKTVSSVYLVSLTELMGTLHTCEPHFVRCLVPNTHKKPGEVEPPLIMHQLTCNGVLEGIRICMRGFPNRMLYPDFKARYAILGEAEIASSTDNKTSAYALMDKIGFDRERYRLGHTLVFFRAGALAGLEEARDEIVLTLLRKLQGQCLKHIRGQVFAKKRDQRELMNICQRNFRKYIGLRNWGWFVLIQKTRPMVGMPNDQQELGMLEEKCQETYGFYEEAVNVTKEMEADIIKVKEEIIALNKQLQQEQGEVGQYTERQQKASAAKAELETALKQAQNALASEEASRKDMVDEKKNLEGGITAKKREEAEVHLHLQKVEQEMHSRDHTIRGLHEEIANQDEIINKVNKEKKHCAENNAKYTDDLHSAEDKVNHLTSIKKKLEATLDELEGSLEREKKNRGDVERNKRKTEGDLKIMQENVATLERVKKDLDGVLLRKDKDCSFLGAKLEEEQGSVRKLLKGIKEMQGRVEEIEEELETERQAYTNAERQRADMTKTLDDLGDRLDQAGGATSAQMELNKKREAEIKKLRKDLEEANIQHEATLTGLKKKQEDALLEMNEQIDQLQKMKSKIDKDKTHIQREIGDCRAACEEIARAKMSAEKSNRTLQTQLSDLTKKVGEANMGLSDIENIKKRFLSENTNYMKCLGELENTMLMLTKIRSDLSSQFDEAKIVADNEARERALLLGKYRNMEHEVDGAREAFEEESGAYNNVCRLVTKAETEAAMWHKKYEVDAVAKAEELEMAKMKLQARLSESEYTITNGQLKLSQLEKAKSKIQDELNEMSNNLDQAQILNNTMEKRAKQFDRLINEWKSKVDSLSVDLDNSQKDCRNVSSDLFKVKAAYEESILQLDEVRRENKSLSNEIKDIMDQISEGGHSIHEIDKIRKRLEAEKAELQAALEEAESTLEQEENKVLRCQLELSQVRSEIDRRLSEKEDEFAMIRKNQGSAIEGMQMALETESKSKLESLRMKKKLETDVADLGVHLDHANSCNVETQKTIQKYVAQVRDARVKYEEENRQKVMLQDTLVATDRKLNANRNALEEARSMLEQSDRNRRVTETELHDCNEQLSEAVIMNQALTSSKRKLEAELLALSADMDEMTVEARMSEERACKAMVDAAQLADELRNEQNNAQKLEKDRKFLEVQCKDLTARCDDAETNALKGGRKAISKLETRIHELETEMDAESRRFGDAQKTLRKSERHIKELTFAQDEDRKNHERMQALIDQLQDKIKTYKKQIEEAEEIAALNLAKYRQVQGSVTDAHGAADFNEQALAKLKATRRCCSVGLEHTV